MHNETEVERLAVLERYQVLDTGPEKGFDDIVRLAARLCAATIGLITFVDGTRQFFKARLGFEGDATSPLDVGFCPIVVRRGRPLVIPDTILDAAHANNAAVSAGGVRFYAGVPLLTADHVPLGTLCVLDTKPHAGGLSADQLDAMETLGREVMARLELRRESVAQSETLAALRESEARQALALNISRLGTYEWTIATNAVILDARAREIFGFAENEGTTAEEVFARIHRDDLPDVHAAAMRCAATSQRLEIEYRIQLPDGELRTVSSQCDFLCGPEGASQRAVGVFADATERMRAVVALRESEARLRAIVGTAPVGIVMADEKGAIYGGNARAEHILGHAILRSADAASYGDWVSFHPDGRRVQGREYPLARVYAGEEHPELECQYLRGDGRRAWVRLIGAPVRDETDRFIGAIVALVDIDREKRSESGLRQLNETLETVVGERTAERDRAWRLSQELLAIAAPDGTLEMVNATWTALLGWSEQELLGNKFLEYTHPDDLEATLAAFASVFERPLVTPYEYRFRHKDGSYRWFAWTGAFENDRVYASGRHTTVERDQAEALRQSQKMEAVGQLTGGLAHDFNNLLAGISGSLELMQLRLQQGRFADVERYLVAAQGASKRAAALTHRLLAFSRRQTLDPRPTDVARLVTGMQELIQRTVGPGIPVEVVGASGSWPALVDPSQLENALLNLCINARDAMPDGGRITIETANRWFDQRAARREDMAEGQYLSLCVTDTGTGMSPEVVARVFEPFFTTKPTGEGTGLGLSMIYGFAQQSGGQVRVHSQVGQGTTVCIHLPRHHGKVADEVATDKRADLPRSEQGATVLVVDDEPTVRMLVTDILGDLGYAAIEAGDSASGLRILRSDARIDLLVTDVGLPGGMNGRQMADAAHAVRPDLKVLFITGYAENAALGNGQLAPGMAVLTKPFPVETMAARIRAMIETARPGQPRR